MDVILVLEDDAANRTVFSAVLRREGYQVISATCAREAFDAARQYRGAIALLIADVRLPDISGTEVALFIRECYPHLPVLFTSGTPIDCWAEEDLEKISSLPEQSYSFLPKPFTCWALTAKVSGMLTRAGLVRTA